MSSAEIFIQHVKCKYSDTIMHHTYHIYIKYWENLNSLPYML